MVSPFRGSGPFRGRGPFLGRGPWAGKAPWGFNLGGVAWTPATLFASGEAGAWYDPSDLTTLFQDSAGTTPVTAVEQPVGLMLDKSRGLVLGSELVTNGDFSGGTTGWTVVGGGSLSVESGRLRVTSNGTLTRARRAVTVTSGRWYKVSLEAYKGTAVNYLVYLGSSSGATDYLNRQSPDGAFTAYVYTTTTTLSMDLFCGTSTNGLYSEYDNISVRELPGNHAFNTNATTVRPVLSARYNQLLRTEQFENAAWTKSNLTVGADAGTAPDFTETADKLIPGTGVGTTKSVFNASPVAVVSGSSIVGSVWVKAAGYNFVNVVTNVRGDYTGSVCVNLTTGATSSAGANGTYTVENVGDGWFRITATSTATTTNGYLEVHPRATAGTAPSTFTGNGTDGVLVWGADLRVANESATIPYQQVTTSTDYDATPGTFPYYLRFDGSDDWLQTASIDFSGTDKMSVFAGVHKASDAAYGAIVELTSSPTNTDGAFAVGAASDAGGSIGRTTWASYIRRTNLSGVLGYSFVSPVTSVISSQMDFAALAQDTQNVIRVNGATPAYTLNTLGAGVAGAGNFANAALYIGRRGGTTAPFNGRLYSLIVRGALTDAGTIALAETYVAAKSGVTL